MIKKADNWYLEYVYTSCGQERTILADQSCPEFTLVHTFQQILFEVPASPLLNNGWTFETQIERKRKILWDVNKQSLLSTWRLHKDQDLTGCNGYRYYLGPPCEPKLARNLEDQCKWNPYRYKFW